MWKHRIILKAALLLIIPLGGILSQENTPAKFIRANAATILGRLKKPLKAAGVSYPPKAVRLAVFKAERKVELWLPDAAGKWKYVKDYQFTATSGNQGPKVYYADLQIPEGIYNIDSLGLSHAYHLAMHIDHPNAFDSAMLELEGRDPAFMSTGIYVHGGAISYGCVVIGNRNIEEVFLLSYMAGKENTKVYIFPHDTNRTEPAFRPCTHCPVWYAELTRHLAGAIREFNR